MPIKNRKRHRTTVNCQELERLFNHVIEAVAAEKGSDWPLLKHQLNGEFSKERTDWGDGLMKYMVWLFWAKGQTEEAIEREIERQKSS